ncbi:LacI family DNA-binding transcriptional regulator, partial [Altererythrobacter sp.]
MEKRPTIMDIARVAGVSFKTVSRVLNGNSSVGSELRDRVLKASAELNYRPNLAARSLASTRHHAIAMVIGKETMEYASSEGWYLPPFVMDFQARALVACQQRGYRFHIEIVDETSSSLAMQLSAQQLHVDGIILAPPLADSATVMEALEQNALPYVRVSPGLEIDRTSAVMVDEYGGAFAMTEYLLSLGHRRIGFIHGHPDHLAAKRRYVAFHDAMSASQETEELTEIGSFTFA